MERVTSTSTAAALVRRMLTIEGEPVVTITAPLDRRRPGNDADRIRLRNLLTDARNRVLDANAGAGGGQLLEGLEGALAEVALSGQSEAGRVGKEGGSRGR